MWNEKEFNKMVKELRIESRMLSKRYGQQIFISFYLHFRGDDTFEINPFCINLKSKEFSGTNAITGKYVSNVSYKIIKEIEG